MRHAVRMKEKNNVALPVLFVDLIFLFPSSKVRCSLVCLEVQATFWDMKPSVKYVVYTGIAVYRLQHEWLCSCTFRHYEHYRT